MLAGGRKEGRGRREGETMTSLVPYPSGLIVEDDEVAVADVESGQVIAGVLGVEDVLVHHERRPPRLGRVPAEALLSLSLLI